MSRTRKYPVGLILLGNAFAVLVAALTLPIIDMQERHEAFGRDGVVTEAELIGRFVEDNPRVELKTSRFRYSDISLRFALPTKA